jgi:hypothetical protein
MCKLNLGRDRKKTSILIVTIDINYMQNSITKQRPHNSTYKKLAVQWLNEALCFVSSSVLADRLVLRNRQLLVAANRYASPYKTTVKKNIIQKTLLLSRD